MLAFMADVHVGNHRKFGGGLVRGVNDRCSLTLHTLRRAMEFCSEQGAEDIVIAGDLFHAANPSPQLIHRVGHQVLSTDKVIHLLVGNHDQISAGAADHAMAPYSLIQQGVQRFSARETPLYLYELPMVKWLRRNNEDIDLIMVPFIPGRAEDYLNEVMDDAVSDQLRHGTHRILCLHLGIWDDETQPFLRGCNDAVSLDLVRELIFSYDLRLVIAGNWHSHRQWQFENFNGEPVFVVQCGALCPTGFSDLGTEDKGNVVLWDGLAPEFKSIPGPRFFKFTGVDQTADFLEERVADVANEPLGYSYFIKVIAADDEVADVESMVEEAKEKGVPIKGVEISRDDAVERSAARTAASMARKTENIEEALHSYIEVFPINDLSDRDSIKNRVLEYRKNASVDG